MVADLEYFANEMSLQSNLSVVNKSVQIVTADENANVHLTDSFSGNQMNYQLTFYFKGTDGKAKLNLYAQGKSISSIELKENTLEYTTQPVTIAEGDILSVYIISNKDLGFSLKKVEAKHVAISSPSPGPLPKPMPKPEPSPKPKPENPKFSDILKARDTRKSDGSLPFRPGAFGHGVYTKGGSGGKVFKVTNTKSSGSGSLKACIDATGPRICVFEVSGLIKTQGYLNINNDYLTIAGQTAPFPGITIQSHALRVQASNIIIEHVRVFSSDELTNKDENDTGGYANRNAIVVGYSKKSLQNIVLNHVTAAFGSDGILTQWYGVDNLTVRRSFLGLPLHQSMHVDEGGSGWENLAAHGMSTLIGHWAKNVDIHQSLIAYSNWRNPRTGAKNLSYFNNINYHYAKEAMQVYTRESNKSAFASIIGNHFIHGTAAKGDLVVAVPGSGGFPFPVQVHLSDTIWENQNGSQNSTSPSSTIRVSGGKDKYFSLKSSPEKLPYKSDVLPASETEIVVSSLMGAWPSLRSPLEKEIAENLQARKGEHINCYTEKSNQILEKKIKQYASEYASNRCELDGKGWTSWREWFPKDIKKRSLDSLMPSPAEKNKKLPSGYTKMDAFLHACSRYVEFGTGSCHKNNIDPQGTPWP